MTWRPLTHKPYSPAPVVDTDPRSKPIDFTLTPRERDLAVQATLHLERNRRELNERDN